MNFTRLDIPLDYEKFHHDIFSPYSTNFILKTYFNTLSSPQKFAFMLMAYSNSLKKI